MLDNIRVVPIHTSHPGNIGSVARAMKTMGCGIFIWWRRCNFHQKAYELASNAADVLESARVVSTVDEAIADCGLVVGTSTRSRVIPWPMLTPRELAQKHSRKGRIIKSPFYLAVNKRV